MNLQGIRLIDTPEEVKWVCDMFRIMIEDFCEAIQNGEKALELCEKKSAKEFIKTEISKWKVLLCLIKNQDHIYKFHAAVKKAPVEPPEIRLPAANQDYQRIMEIMRAETDNILELIDLLSSAGSPLLLTAEDKEHEDTFWFGPDLVEQLQLKVKIMMNHWVDPQRLFSK
ncbi:MAG TPA: hypothetical protein DC049_01705 [Spirochaetia bacterium]|nr:hypothetical protein [Spirochaetia bacterium]